MRRRIKIVKPRNKIKRVRGPFSHVQAHKAYLTGAPKTAVHEIRTKTGNKLLTAKMINQGEIKVNLLQARGTSKIKRRVTRPINVEIGDHYLFSKIDYFNAAHIFGEALINSLRLENVVRTSLTDDVHVRRRKGRKKTDERRFNKWVNLKGKRIRTLRESSASKTYNELRQLCDWTEEGACRHFDAILYIRKLGLESKVAVRLAKRHGVSAKEIIKAFNHLPRIPVSEQAIVVLPELDEHRQSLRTEQEQTKKVLRELFRVDQRTIDNKIHPVYYDIRTLKAIESEFVSARRSAALRRGKLPKEKQTQLVYRTLTFGKSSLADLQQAERFLRSAKTTGLTEKNNSRKLVYFNELVGVLGDFPGFKKMFQQGSLSALGDYHSDLVKAINSLNSELRQKQSDGLISAQEVMGEKTFNSVLSEARNALNYSLQLMNCQSLAA